MNVWLMKTYREWADLFLNGPFFVSIDEEGINTDYGRLDSPQRISLFTHLQLAGNSAVQYGLVKMYFDEFYDSMESGDIIILGTGQRIQYNVAAVLRVTGNAYFACSVSAGEPRHRREVEVLWQGDSFPVQEWGFARRLELLDSIQRYKELTQVLVRLV